MLEKEHIFTFTRPINAKLGRVVTEVEGFLLTQSRVPWIMLSINVKIGRVETEVEGFPLTQSPVPLIM